MNTRFIVERKVDPVAVAAFIMALVNGIYFLVGYMRAADLVLLSPDQLLLREDGRYLRISTRITCMNRGRPGYSGVVEDASVAFIINGRRYEQKWQSFGYSSSEGNILKVTGEGEAHPFAVDGGSVVSRETHFAARTSPDGSFSNFLRYDEFLKLLPAAKHLEVTLTTRIYDESLQTVNCRVIITKRLIKALEDKRWSAPSCLKSMHG